MIIIFSPVSSFSAYILIHHFPFNNNQISDEILCKQTKSKFQKLKQTKQK